MSWIVRPVRICEAGAGGMDVEGAAVLGTDWASVLRTRNLNGDGHCGSLQDVSERALRRVRSLQCARSGLAGGCVQPRAGGEKETLRKVCSRQNQKPKSGAERLHVICGGYAEAAVCARSLARRRQHALSRSVSWAWFL